MNRATLNEIVIEKIRRKIDELIQNGSIIDGTYSVTMPTRLTDNIQVGKTCIDISILKLEENPISGEWINHTKSLVSKPYDPDSTDPYEYVRVSAVSKYTEQYIVTENVLQSLLLEYRDYFDMIGSVNLCRFYERECLDEKITDCQNMHHNNVVSYYTRTYQTSKRVVNL